MKKLIPLIIILTSTTNFLYAKSYFVNTYDHEKLLNHIALIHQKVDAELEPWAEQDKDLWSFRIFRNNLLSYYGGGERLMINIQENLDEAILLEYVKTYLGDQIAQNYQNRKHHNTILDIVIIYSSILLSSQYALERYWLYEKILNNNSLAQQFIANEKKFEEEFIKFISI